MGKGSKRPPPATPQAYEKGYEKVGTYKRERPKRPGKTTYVIDPKTGNLVPKKEWDQLTYIGVDPAHGEDLTVFQTVILDKAKGKFMADLTVPAEVLHGR